ncbi:MAG TPA: hypothetical protein VM165_00100 [Planctomycetaceae bacterium]|nr:hypothetical protein [Planctomycetaceae bacterium]
MHAKVDGLRLDAESLTDWRYYVCQFPLSSVLSAAVLGFWLTPGHRVTPTVKLDDRTIDNLVDRGVVRMEAAAPPKTAWWRPLGSLAVNLLGKAALAYVGQHLVRQQAEATAEETVETMR